MMEAGYSMHNPKWLTSTLFGDANTFKATITTTTPISEGDESKQSNAVITDEQQVGDTSGVDIGSSSVIQDALTGSTYTWSSVGPASDGAQGVDVCAPGDNQSIVFCFFIVLGLSSAIMTLKSHLFLSLSHTITRTHSLRHNTYIILMNVTQEEQ
jgi:hypothetical protein